MTRPTWDSVTVGDTLPHTTVALQRRDLVRYCGASLDFNPLHWSTRSAREAGQADVIAHGMLTMAAAARVLTDWCGDPGAVVEYGVTFSRPVVVADDGTGTAVDVRATVEDKLEGSRVAIGLTVRVGEAKVLTAARAVVRLR